MGKILVTGGAGYIGSHVNKALASKGFDTLVLDNLSCGHRELAKWGQFILADLHDKEQLRLIFEQYDISGVMHFAASAYVGESITNPLKYYRNNVANTLNLIEVILEFGVSKFVFSSTCATYGIPGELPIPETHAQHPINPYGRSKLMIENILADTAASNNFKYVSLRYFNAAGADPDGDVGEWHDPETHLIPLALDAASGIKKCIGIYGTDYETSDGTCIRDYIHVTDLADAHVKALEFLSSGNASEVFNLGNEKGFSVREVISCVRKVTGRQVEVEEVQKRPGDPPVLVGDNLKAASLLNWRPRFTDIHDIIATAWSWHRTLPQKSAKNTID